MPVDWQRKYGPLTVQQYAIAGGIVIAGLVILRRRKAAQAGSSAAAPTLDTGTYEAGYGAGYGAGVGGGGGGSGPAPSPTSTGSPPGGASAPPDTGPPAPTGQPITGSPGNPGSTSPAAGGPPNTYQLGQLVNPTSGERIVSQAFSPVYGWLNLTNLGGVYTGGGGTPGSSIGKLPFGGSYLGYVANRYGVGTPAAKQEQALHGQFGAGGISIQPGGGYTLINTRKESYNYGH